MILRFKPMLPEKSLYYEPLHMNNSQKDQYEDERRRCA